jgi:hypothetical protein
MSISQYFAQLNENNVVVSVHVVTKEFMDENPERYTGTWVETFVDVLGKTYAASGYIYDPETQDFTQPIEPPMEQ